VNAVYVLWLRQLKRYARSRARIVGALGQPLLFLLGLGFGLGPVFEKAGQGNYVQFLAPGVVAMTVLFTSVFSGIELIWDRRFGFLKETLVAPVPRLAIMLGRVLGGATVAVIQGLIVVVLSLLAGFRFADWHALPLGLLFMVLVAILFTSLGTVIASWMSDFQGFQLVMNFMVMPTFFLSGALFPVRNLPWLLNILVRVNPMSYGVDGLRGALTGASTFSIAADMTVLVAGASFLLVLGAYAFSRIEL
jgi:ABC-2 type transport system permease protein